MFAVKIDYPHSYGGVLVSTGVVMVWVASRGSISPSTRWT